MYADDNTLHEAALSHNLQSIQVNLQMNIAKVERWCKTNMIINHIKQHAWYVIGS